MALAPAPALMEISHELKFSKIELFFHLFAKLGILVNVGVFLTDLMLIN